MSDPLRLLLNRFPLRPALALAFALLLGGIAHAQVPTISTQPRGQTVNAGTSVTFTVVATGTPTYQWMFDGAPVAGATGASYVLTSAVPANAGVYTVVATNASGTVTSAAANLLIYVPFVATTVAGKALTAGPDDGTGGAARFDFPNGIAVDTTGNLYVADTINSVIRKIAPGGVVTTLAGAAGQTGFADGTGGAARFYFPTGIAIDASGNLYVADTFNSTIRKIAPGGIVTTLAGTPPTPAVPNNVGSANGTGAVAKFYFPRGIAVDNAGNVYVADTYNNTIRKIAPGGVVTTLAGAPGQNGNNVDGTGAVARFNDPYGLAVDAQGTLWVADSGNSTIRAVTAAGVVTTLAGLAGNAGSTGGTGTFARFSFPTGIAVDSLGNLYISDSNNHAIREVTSGGAVVTLSGLAGSPGAADASGSNARFNTPLGIAVDGAGNVFVSDTDNHTIRTASPQLPTDFIPQIQTQPQGQTANQGSSVVLSVAASGNPAPTYQWMLNGAAVAGGTGPILTLNSAQASDTGTYTVVVTNRVGSATSNAATVTIIAQPSITVAPVSQTISAGGNTTLSVTATGGGLSYQWFINGAVIPSATAATLPLTNVGTVFRGSYTVAVTNSAGSVVSAPAVLSVTSSSRLLNLSARAGVGTGGNVLIAGFVTAGSGQKKMLLRGIGPGLVPFGLSGTLASPQLTLSTAAGAVLGSNSGWGGTSALTQLFSQVGAFALPSTSSDAAISTTLNPGAYTEQVAGAAGTSGLGMAELYDADTGSPSARLVNISARANVGTGANVLIGGFVVAGTTSETVLVRGIGPGLVPFGLSGTLSRPLITLQDSTGKSVATNSGWGGSVALSNVFSQVQAFALSGTSTDAALVVTVPPGAYTVILSGVSSTTGLGMVEIYEVP